MFCLILAGADALRVYWPVQVRAAKLTDMPCTSMAVLAATAGNTSNHPTILCGSYDNKVLNLLIFFNLTLKLQQLLCMLPACRSFLCNGSEPYAFPRWSASRGIWSAVRRRAFFGEAMLFASRCMPCSMGGPLAPLKRMMMLCPAWRHVMRRNRSSVHPGTAQ